MFKLGDRLIYSQYNLNTNQFQSFLQGYEEDCPVGYGASESDSVADLIKKLRETYEE